MPRAGGQSPAHSLSKDNVRDHYDQFAWAYRRFWGDHLHHGLFLTGKEDSARAQESMLRHCAERAGVQPGSAVADVGCGHGGTARFLAREFSCRVFGLTISEAQIKIARRNCESLNGAVRFELGDAESFPFPHAGFDLVWNMESSEHFFNKTEYFLKAADALRPGGRLMLAAWSGSMSDPLIRDIARVFLCPELWTAQEYAKAIEAAGLQVVSSQQFAAEVVRTWDICSQRVHDARWLLSVLPAQFREFAEGIELMRQGYRNGQLAYLIMTAQKA